MEDRMRRWLLIGTLGAASARYVCLAEVRDLAEDRVGPLGQIGCRLPQVFSSAVVTSSRDGAEFIP